MSTIASTPTVHRAFRRGPRPALITLTVLGLLLTAVAELIGAHTFHLGIGSVTLYPLVWGVLLGGVVSIQRIRAVPVRVQQIAGQLVQVGILLLSARLAFVVGANLPVLKHVGAALLLQELGHLLGTVAFALPVAVLLKMGRSTVGACFSIDREGSFAMVAERFGPDSDEYRGVLAMYIFGTVVGALYISLLASFLAHAGIFDPLALAMGAGVGSGSMMAAATSSIASQYPAVAHQVLAVAAVSNLVTSFLGLYVGMYIALPLADRFYRLLTRNQPQTSTIAASIPEATESSAAPSPWFAFPLVLVAMFIAEAIVGHGVTSRLVGGLALMTSVVAVAMVLRRYTRLSAIIGVTTIGLLVTCPWSPVATSVSTMLTPVDFLALTTPVLVFAGLGIGKDARLLSTIGWKVIPVGLISFAATFIASAAVAQLALH